MGALEEEVIKPVEEAPVEKSPQEQLQEDILNEIVQVVNEARSKLPSGTFGVFKVEYTSGDGIKMNFSIKPREFRKKTDEEISILIKSQIQKQVEEQGLDLSIMTTVKMAKSPEEKAKVEEKKPAPVEEVIKPVEEAPVEKAPEKKPEEKKPEEKKPAEKKPEEKKPAEKKPEEKKTSGEET